MGTKRARAVLVGLAVVVATAMAVVPAGSASATSDTISGTITAEGGGDVSYTGIEVFTPDPDGDWEWLEYKTTDADGNFSVSLPHGQYRLEFNIYDSIHVPVFYGGASDLDSATTVDNSSGPVSGIDGVLPIGGKIVGTVPSMKGSVGAVYAYVESSPGHWKSVWANGLTFTDRVDGGFTFSALPTGNYKIWFDPYGDTYGPEYYDNSPDLDGATPIAVTNGSTSGPISATLPLKGKITGHVITSAGADLGGVVVVPFEKVDGEWQKVLGAQDTTDSHGRYSIPIGAGTYRIKFTDTKAQRAFEYWPNVHTTIDHASSFTVAAGQTTASKNAIMERAARIAGTVSYPAGVPGSATLVENNVEGTITLYDAVTGEVVRSKYVFARVGEGSAFAYSLAGIPAGKYRIAFARDVGASNIEAQFYSGKPESVAAKASVLTLTSGQNRTGVNATMRIGGTLTGYVLRSDGSPATGCKVYAYTGDNSRVTRIAEIGSDGRFRVQGLTTGAYRLKVLPDLIDDPLDYRAHCKTTEYYQGGSGALTKTETDGIAVHATATKDTLLGTPLYYGLGTAPSLSTIQNTTLPSVTGTAHVGQKLTASPGVWSPVPDQVRYQWLRDGVGIAGEVSSKYLVKAADKGHKLSVRVSAYVFGQNPNTAVSATKTVS